MVVRMYLLHLVEIQAHAVVVHVVVVGNLEARFAPIFTITILLHFWRLILININLRRQHLRQCNNLCRVGPTTLLPHLYEVLFELELLSFDERLEEIGIFPHVLYC